jgi:hypothetical protein
MGIVPPETKQIVEILDLVSAVELTLNVSAPGPTSLVIHCNDEAGAQKLEATIQESLQKLRAAKPAEQPAGDDPIAQAMERYKDRMLQLFQPQRSGNSIKCIHLDGQNPAQQQIVAVGIGIIGTAVVGGVRSVVQAGRGAPMPVQAAPGAGGPSDDAAAPGSQ